MMRGTDGERTEAVEQVLEGRPIGDLQAQAHITLAEVQRGYRQLHHLSNDTVDDS